MEGKERAKRFRQAREDCKQSLRTVDEMTGISKSTIQKLENKDNDTNVGYQDIVKLADYYGVNVAWLMGRAESPSLDESSQVVTNVTGLSPKAIDNLQRITDESEKCMMNYILESELFRTVITWMSLAKEMVAREQNTDHVESWDDKREIDSEFDDYFNVYMRLSPKESARYYLSMATQTAEDALSLMIREQWTQKMQQWTQKKIKEAKNNGKRNEEN